MKITSPIRVGVVGLGQRGLQHLKVLWKLQQEGIVHIITLIDTYADNLAEDKISQHVDGFRLGQIYTSTDFFGTLKSISLDALYFAIPPSIHKGEIVSSAQAGIHIFAEKPMSLYLNEVVEMEQEIASNGVIATVGFQQRYDSRFEAAQRFLSDKEIVMISMIMNSTLEAHSVKHTHTEKQGGPINRIWTSNYQWSGSTVVEAGIHQVDLMRYWAGDIAWVEANYVDRDSSDIVDGGDNPYAYQVTFGFASGTIGNLILSRLRKVFYTDNYNSILWTHGHLKFEPDGVAAYHYEGAYPPDQTPSQEEIRHLLPLAGQRNATEEISRAFFNAIATGDKQVLRSTFSSGMNSLVAVLGANLSHQLNGQRIYLDELLTNSEFEWFRQK
ncbi:MAG: Gfo/Idh/MocA family oxidoreductase [Candidatus Poribacteria bacterium]|nr:Gfo/Idh/MocA family oxidoreductase [Candidatus Poribacteria bacterium]